MMDEGARVRIIGGWSEFRGKRGTVTKVRRHASDAGYWVRVDGEAGSDFFGRRQVVPEDVFAGTRDMAQIRDAMHESVLDYGGKIHGEDANKTVDIEFPNVVAAVKFATHMDLLDRAKFTYEPKLFTDPVTVSFSLDEPKGENDG